MVRPVGSAIVTGSFSNLVPDAGSLYTGFFRTNFLTLMYPIMYRIAMPGTKPSFAMFTKTNVVIPPTFSRSLVIRYDTEASIETTVAATKGSIIHLPVNNFIRMDLFALNDVLMCRYLSMAIRITIENDRCARNIPVNWPIEVSVQFLSFLYVKRTDEYRGKLSAPLRESTTLTHIINVFDVFEKACFVRTIAAIKSRLTESVIAAIPM